VEPRRWVRNLGYSALAGVVLQGVLGGLRVTMLKDEIGIFHACVAQAFFGLVVFIALVMSKPWNRFTISTRASRVFSIAMVATALIYAQLGLGATMRHQHRDLAILDFPTAYGNWIPDLDPDKLAQINGWRDAHGLSNVTASQVWLQMTHRFVAVAIAIAVVACWVSVRKHAAEIVALRRFSNAWVFFLACQLTLGAWTIWSNKAADIATAHVAVGAVMLGCGVAMSALSSRCSRSTEAQPSSVTIAPREMEPA
jgi:cytochrome c oxidase assembly protein subunit 15